MYAIQQSRMLFRNVYRFGRKSPFLGCLMSCSLSPRHSDCTEAFCWCSQRPGGTWAGTCNSPVKQPWSMLVTQGGASLRGTVHRGRTLSRVGFPALVTLPLALQRSVRMNEQNIHLSGTRVWGPGTDTNPLLTFPQRSSSQLSSSWHKLNLKILLACQQ